MIRGAVLGSPITHSLSPRLHRAAFSHLGVDANYEAVEVPAGSLENFIKERGDEFLPGEDYINQWGYKVDARGTIPYK